jgi:hypothetical protein
LPISTEDGKPFVCGCGRGDFPKKYLANTKDFKVVAEFAVRVAVPVIFAPPISKDNAGLVDAKKASTRAYNSAPATRTQPRQPEKEGCLKCDAATTKAGNPLLKCSKCKTAQYCSPDCQKKDWKKHKQTCKQAQEKGVGDDAA